MKRIVFALSVCALCLCVLPRSNAQDVTVDFFYNSLDGGSWIDADEYGYGWQPDVAVNDPDWRPYADGYWAYTDYGWTWVSYEDFGWATYHYGGWLKLAGYGWVWFPGNNLEWGPAWVSWRFGGNQCGWAPLPPRVGEVVYEGRPVGGHLDIEFDIGPGYYNFIDIRFIGEPVLRSHIYAPTYNVTYINKTVNVTNITVKNKVVYNYGPDYDVLAKHSERPIQRLKIERERNVNLSTAAKSGGLTKVQGGKLMVAAPEKIERSAKQIAPPKVKTKVAKNQLKVERGWGVVGDEKAQTEFKQKIRNQDLKKIPPPTEGATSGQAAGATGTPPAGEGEKQPGMKSVSGLKSETEMIEKGKGKGRRGGEQAESTAAPEMSPGGEGSPAEAFQGREHKGKRNQPLITPSAPPKGTTAEGNATTSSSQNEIQTKQGRKAGQFETQNKMSSFNQSESSPSTSGQATQEQGEQGKRKVHRMEGTPPPSGSANQGSAAGGPVEEKPGKRKGQQFNPPQQGGGQSGQGGEGKREGGKKNKGENSPAPTP